MLGSARDEVVQLTHSDRIRGVAQTQPSEAVRIDGGTLAPGAEPFSISVIVPNLSNLEDARDILGSYREALAKTITPVEVICVGGSGTRDMVDRLTREGDGWGPLIGIEPSVEPTEDGALKLGIARASGEWVLLLPGWREVRPSEVARLFTDLGDCDMVLGLRQGLSRSPFGRVRANGFHWLLKRLFRQNFRDLFCRVRLGRRAVFEQANVLGVRQHFVPLLAAWEGYKVKEIPLRAGRGPDLRTDPFHFSLLGHFRATVDLIALYVTLKFLQRPLRFFGSIGLPVTGIGCLITAWLVVSRLLGSTALAERPALMFGVLFIVLGVQIIAIGLIGEIITFTATRRSKTYEVAECVQEGRATQRSSSGSSRWPADQS